MSTMRAASTSLRTQARSFSGSAARSAPIGTGAKRAVIAFSFASSDAGAGTSAAAAESASRDSAAASAGSNAHGSSSKLQELGDARQVA